MEKGIVIEYDFAAIDGAQLLFDTAKAFFAKLDNLQFDSGLEARFLAGQNYLLGLTQYFQSLKTKKTAQKAAKELPLAFQKALTQKIKDEGLDDKFVKFVKAMAEKGVKVCISTRANVEQVEPVFKDLLSDDVKLHFENSVTYGNVKWDAWVRAAQTIGTQPGATLVVAGSGFGVRSALIARFFAIGVQTPHTEWQDYSGANLVTESLDANVAKFCQKLMRIEG